MSPNFGTFGFEFNSIIPYKYVWLPNASIINSVAVRCVCVVQAPLAGRLAVLAKSCRLTTGPSYACLHTAASSLPLAALVY